MLGSSVVGVTTTVIVLDGFAKIMAGCKSVDEQELLIGYPRVVVVDRKR